MKTTENEAACRTREILRNAGFHLLSEVEPKPQAGVVYHWSRMQFWGGATRGVIILQEWKDGNGCHSYADWPLGNTFEELEQAIAKAKGQ